MVFVCVCLYYTAVWSQQQDKNNSVSFSVIAQFFSSAVAHLSAYLDFFSHTDIHTHSQAIRGRKRVTFSYLVSRVTRKKLSSGASIQLGRLLRIITPPRVFPLLLLRPLCCKKMIKYNSISISSDVSVQELFNKTCKTPTRRGPPVVPGFSAKQSQSNEREMQSMHKGICQLWIVLISLLLFLVTSGATNDCVSISVKIVKLPIKNKVSDWSWIIQIIQMTPICWFVFIRISCHSLQRASLDKKWQKRLSTPGVH